MVIIDNKEDLQKLRSKLHSDNVNCVPILSDTNFHPKKNRISKPPAASPPIVATIQSGILPISLIKLESV